jgi:hypothetical protein
MYTKKYLEFQKVVSGDDKTMFTTLPNQVLLVTSFLLLSIPAAAADQPPRGSWIGWLRDDAQSPVLGAVVQLSASNSTSIYSAVTDGAGSFRFDRIGAGEYIVSVRWQGKTWTLSTPLDVGEGAKMALGLELSLTGQVLTVISGESQRVPQGTGGEHLSSGEVSSLPLNKRDFSQLLLLAAGTMTDTNGAANYTQQFAVNGQRGTTTVFAMDGIDTTDPELGGATFSNFNVDAIQEVASSSGVMPAEIGHGAAGFTNLVTKSGSNTVHGSVFEFARNAAFDARNFFDRQSEANPGRIPPFVRNEFGFTNGGPVVLPKIYGGRDRTFYYGQYQGFRQVLGTTQIVSVPTSAERQGLDISAFPGDTLKVPVDARIAPVLATYPLPNDPQGPYAARSFATSSKVSTSSNQFSVRIDHRISERAQLFVRFNLNNVNGPLTNPSQTVIDPTFAIRFLDHQRNAGFKYARTITPNLTSVSSFGFIRSTPSFPTINHVQPGLTYGDGLYEAFNSAAGTLTGAFGNLYQVKEDVTYGHGSHTLAWGVEMRFNKDATVFGLLTNGSYTFGGGTAYAQVAIPSLSGRHDVHVGDPLPDALTGFLTATPYSYTAWIASPYVGQGDRFNESAVRREAYNFYFQDGWKITRHVQLHYGLRYEANSRIGEAKKRTSAPRIVGPEGNEARFWDPGVGVRLLVNPQPPYDQDWNGWGPRLGADWEATEHTVLHAGGGITTRLPNLWQDNYISGGLPFSASPYITALPGVPVPFQNSVLQQLYPVPYTVQGQPLFATGRTTDVASNTELDLPRFQNDLTALTPGHQLQLLSLFGMARNFRNGYIGTYTAGLDQELAGGVKFNASYVATVGVNLSSIAYPNSFPGAGPGFAPFTTFDASGQVTGGVGPANLMSSGSHSTYHALQTSITKTWSATGSGLQASYTYSKSLDDASTALPVTGGGSAGTILQSPPQNPWDLAADKGPSTFDVTEAFTLSVIMGLPLERVAFLQPLGAKLTSGWQLLNVTTLLSGSPFSVFSGVQQTGAGAGADRPDQTAEPGFSTSRKVREDYFGRGSDNASFFAIPIDLPGGTGPNRGRFGSLGRDTFRGPSFHNFDVALIKDTRFGTRGGPEFFNLQFRAEFFNVFNLVNFGLPANIVRGTGFGFINRTAGPSRQIQFSLKLMY